MERINAYFVSPQLQEDRVRTMEEKLELADQKVAQLSKLPEVQHELTQVCVLLGELSESTAYNVYVFA